MVANTWTIAERFLSPPQEVLDGRWKVARFTRTDAEALVRLGIIPEDASTELLNGLIVLKDRADRGQDTSMIGKDHRKAVERFSDLRSRISSARRHVQSQQPLICTEGTCRSRTSLLFAAHSTTTPTCRRPLTRSASSR